MPGAGDYLFSNVGFSPVEQPYLSLSRDENFANLAPLGKTLTLRFDTSQRYCIGWGDMTANERFVCPEQHTVDSKYDQCAACQQRTGFNPAFYHATSVSKQQEQRNSQPHILYLAHFGPNIIKVGISYAARGNSRLLEQGARCAVILDTFPTALIARQYEARIASLPGIAETIQLRKKITSLADAYDQSAGMQELIKTRTVVEQALSTTFAQNEVKALDSFYFPSGTPDFSDSYDATELAIISGKAIGILGSLLFCENQDTLTFLPLKKYTGYTVTLTYDETPMSFPARQISLF